MTDDVSTSFTTPKMTLYVCGEKGVHASVLFPKGSPKKGQNYQTSLELDKKFNAICKVRLEIEEVRNGETWYCQEVKNLVQFSFNIFSFHNLTVVFPVVLSSYGQHFIASYL